MTTTTTTAVAVEIYPDEFRLLLKVINRALDSDTLSYAEQNQLNAFKDDFANLALEYGV